MIKPKDKQPVMASKSSNARSVSLLVFRRLVRLPRPLLAFAFASAVDDDKDRLRSPRNAGRRSRSRKEEVPNTGLVLDSLGVIVILWIDT